MLTVSADPVVVESQLSIGALSCPCDGVLRGWGHVRAQAVDVIARVLELAALGIAVRMIATTVAVARSTVRGWVERFRFRAELLRAHFTTWLLWLAPSASQADPAGGPVGDAVAAVVAAGSVAVEVP